MPEYFTIDPTKPAPHAPDVSYECLKCRDVIPSEETAGAPWHCRCNAVFIDHDYHRVSFRSPADARGIRGAGPWPDSGAAHHAGGGPRVDRPEGHPSLGGQGHARSILIATSLAIACLVAAAGAIACARVVAEHDMAKGK